MRIKKKILVTGAKGVVGKNLCAGLKNTRDGKARRWGDLTAEKMFEYDIDSKPEALDKERFFIAGIDSGSLL